MKNILILITLLGGNAFAGGGCASFMNVVPVSHPNGCNAISLENLAADAGTNQTWTFSPAAINAATGTSVTSMVVNSSTLGNPPVWPVVYWPQASIPANGQITIGYDGCTQDFFTCDCNPFAAGSFWDAPLICNTDHYCGNTAAAYIEDFMQNGTPAGGLGANGDGCLFCGSYTTDHEGSIENNSWLKFIADASSVPFNITVYGNCYIQFAVYAYNPNAALGSNGVLTLMTPIAWTNVDTGFTGTQSITATGLVPGNTYYLHFDGHGGADCDYEIGFTSGIVTVDLEADDQLVCTGAPVVLTASPNDPSATYTWTDNHGNTYSGGSQITVNPSSTTTYEVEVNLAGCQNDPQTVLVDIEPCPLPAEILNFGLLCDEEQRIVKWSTASEYAVKEFQVLRSTDLTTFELIGTIDAVGYSNELNHYSFRDVTSDGSKTYYQLRSIDFNGEGKSAGIVTSDDCLASSEFLKAYLAGNGEDIVIETLLESPTEINVEIVDVMGNRLHNQLITAGSGLEKHLIDAARLKGIMLIRMSGSTLESVQKILR